MPIIPAKIDYANSVESEEKHRNRDHCQENVGGHCNEKEELAIVENV
jgi:hypothetical protein